MAACLPWLEAELDGIKPAIAVRLYAMLVAHLKIVAALSVAA